MRGRGIGGKERGILTEPGIGILSLDPLAPVLAEEHIRGEGTFGGFGVLLGFARGFFSLLGSFALGIGGQVVMRGY